MEITIAESELDDMVRNFKELSSGDKPRYLPFAKIGKGDPHKGESLIFEDGNPCAGMPTNLRREGRFIKADLQYVPGSVASWIEGKLFRWVSPEIDRPAPGENHPQFGVKGPVLKAVSILGANPPAMKGLKEIPRPQFQFADQRSNITVSYFSEVNAMTRAEAIATLTKKKFDLSKITDATPDALLFHLAETWPGESNNPAPELSQRFSEMAGQVQTLTATLNNLQSQATATAAIHERVSSEAKRTLVNTFCETHTRGPNPRLSPADVECDAKGEPLPHTAKARLLRADHVRLHTFAAVDGKSQIQKTELELQMDEILKRPPMTFSERMRQPPPGEAALTTEQKAVKDATEYAERRNKQIVANRN